MVFALSARWPLGTYLGHHPDGTPEDFPSFSRVFSALVHAAGVGSAAGGTPAEGFRHLSPTSVEALEWLENNPPTGMILPPWPQWIRAHNDGTFGYRNEGVFQSEGGRTVYKKTARVVGTAAFFAEPITWIWPMSAPEAVARQLDALCADVGVLGEADSPVVLEIDTQADIESRSHVLEPAGFFDQGGVVVQTPSAGRLRALEEQFALAHPAKRPSVSQDKPTLTSKGLPSSEAPTGEELRPLRLRPVGSSKSAQTVPWGEIVILPVVSGPVPSDEDRVDTAVRLHRALIATIGQECPPLVTGRYRRGEQPPPNRVGLHYLPPGSPIRQANREQAHLVVALPRGIHDSDADQIHAGISRISQLRLGSETLHLDSPSSLDGDEFWLEPEAGMTREWSLEPAAIPERAVKGADQFDVLEQTIATSLRNVLRSVHPNLQGATPCEVLSWLGEQGGDVIEAHPRWVTDPARFVHRTKRQIPVMPYRARLRLGSAVPETAFMALGQARHLGGGILVPVDRRKRKESANA